MEMEAISQPELDQIERMGRADWVVGILDLGGKGDGRNDVAMTREALAELAKPLRTMVISNNGHGPAPPGQEVKHDNQSPEIFTYSLPLPGPGETPQQSISNVYRKVFTIGGKLGARACSVIVSQPQAVTPHRIFRLVQPVTDLGFDLVAPCYTRQKMEGLLTRSILSPLQRALYGDQIQYPMGPDFGLSGKFPGPRSHTQDLTRRRGTDVNALASDGLHRVVWRLSSNLRNAFGSSHSEGYRLGESQFSSGGSSWTCISRHGGACGSLAKNSGLKDVTPVRPTGRSAPRYGKRGRTHHDRILSIGNAKPPRRLGHSFAAHNLAGIAKVVPSIGGSLPSA